MRNCFVFFWQMIKNFNATNKIEVADMEIIFPFVRDYKQEC